MTGAKALSITFFTAACALAFAAQIVTGFLTGKVPIPMRGAGKVAFATHPAGFMGAMVLILMFLAGCVLISIEVWKTYRSGGG